LQARLSSVEDRLVPRRVSVIGNSPSRRVSSGPPPPPRKLSEDEDGSVDLLRSTSSNYTTSIHSTHEKSPDTKVPPSMYDYSQVNNYNYGDTPADNVTNSYNYDNTNNASTVTAYEEVSTSSGGNSSNSSSGNSGGGSNAYNMYGPLGKDFLSLVCHFSQETKEVLMRTVTLPTVPSNPPK